MNTRHTVVIRQDLGMTPGLQAAQAAHIADAFERVRILDGKDFSNEEKEWMKDPYISILAVANYEELQIIIDSAKAKGLPVHVWRDLIPSVNLNRPIPDVMVGCSIGPCDFDKVKAVTGTLPLCP